MIEIQGDYWEEVKKGGYDAIVCTTNKIVKANGELVMGVGIALDFKKKFPFLPKKWGEILNKRGQNQGIIVSQVFDIFNENGSQKYVVAFPTKQDWRNDSDITLIRKSSQQLKFLVDALGLKKVLMTRPGCGMGKLKWDDVKKEIGGFLDDRFYVIER